MPSFHNQVRLDGFHFEDFILTFALKAGIVEADVGKPVTLDTTAAKTVKIAGDGDPIYGKLASVDKYRATGAVELRYTAQWPVKSGDALAVGDTCVGSTVSGEVKKAAANAPTVNFVAEIVSGVATVLKV